MDKSEAEYIAGLAPHPLNFLFTILNAILFFYGIYSLFFVGVVKGLILIGISVVLSFLVPKLLGKLILRKFTS